MAKRTAPIYKSKTELADENLFKMLSSAFDDLRHSMIPSIPISKATFHAGFGVDKTSRSLAAESMIAILREIKKRPGW